MVLYQEECLLFIRDNLCFVVFIIVERVMKSEVIIPQSSSPEDIKRRRQIIKDFYAQWISEHPEKTIWNESLGAFIHVKGLSINEILGHAPRSAEATEAQFHLTEILSDARFSERRQPKYGDKNQKSFSIMYLLKWKGCRVLVGYQRSKGEYVLYYISGGQKKAAR